MQGDLISREYLKEAITALYAEKGEETTATDILYEIYHAPVAFDVEEKITKLNKGARRMCFVEKDPNFCSQTKYYKAIGTHFMENTLRETYKKEKTADKQKDEKEYDEISERE